MIPKIIWQYWDNNTNNILNENVVLQNCISSWKKYNKDWDIRFLTRETVNDWIDFDKIKSGIPQQFTKKYPRHPTKPAESDIIRIELLSKYGGIYADCDVFCTMPLDTWIGSADIIIPIKNVPLKHIHNDDMSYILKPMEKIPAGKRSSFLKITDFQSWLIGASPENSIINKWKSLQLKYWHNIQHKPYYFWSLQQLLTLFSSDKKHKSYFLNNTVDNLSLLDATQGQYFRSKETQHISKLKKQQFLHNMQTKSFPYYKLGRKFKINAINKDTVFNTLINLHEKD